MTDELRSAPVPLDIRLDRIQVPAERLAKLDESTVGMLVESIMRVGLLSRIRVAAVSDGTYLLVTGLKRVEAYRRLGRPAIPADVVDGEPEDLELDELEENLARQEWTVLERAMMERRRKELYEIKHANAVRGRAGALAKQGVQTIDRSFADTVARRGSGPRAVQRRVRIANALTPATAALLWGTDVADNVSQLEALAKEPEPLRHDIALIIKSGKAKRVEEAARQLAGTTRLRPPPKDKNARVQLQRSEEGYSAAAYLLGRRLEVRIPGALDVVELVDAGTAQVYPEYSDDAAALTLAEFERIVRETIEELPDEMSGAFSLRHARISNETVVDVSLVVQSARWSRDMRFRLTWWPGNLLKPVGRIDAFGMANQWIGGYVFGNPSIGQLRSGTREYLCQIILPRTHGVTRPVRWSSPTSDAPPAAAPQPSKRSKLIGALVHSGFERNEARTAVQAIGERVETEPLKDLYVELVKSLTNGRRNGTG